jgi:DNA-binding NarL/FixJ family response regulator
MATPVPARVALVDDDSSVHLAIGKTFRAMAKAWTLESYLDSEEAARAIAASPPDVVILDIYMPGLSGIECLRRLKAGVPDLPVLMFTGLPAGARILQSLAAGANGYLVKPASCWELLEAVARVTRGATVLCRQSQGLLAEHLREQMPQTCFMRLTEREKELMNCLVRGLADKAIADAWGVSVGTVHTHCTNMFAKLGVHSRKEAVREYLSIGWHVS